MFCPNCKHELDRDFDMQEVSEKEIEVVWECRDCGEWGTITIAQEDLTQDQS